MALEDLDLVRLRIFHGCSQLENRRPALRRAAMFARREQVEIRRPFHFLIPCEKIFAQDCKQTRISLAPARLHSQMHYVNPMQAPSPLRTLSRSRRKTCPWVMALAWHDLHV